MSSIVTVSLPQPVAAALAIEARRQRRSRSFIVAEAVSAYLGAREKAAFAEARHQTLRDGLALTPAARLQLAEQLWRELASGRQPGPPWVRGFDTFAEYERWRRRGETGP